MSLFISFIYILDIGILIFVLSHRGYLHGAFEEFFHFLSTMIAAFAAFANYEWLSNIIRGYWAPSNSIPEAIAFGLIYGIVRGGLGSSAFYFLSRIRRVELVAPISKGVGVVLGTIKGVVVASVILVFLNLFIPTAHMLAEPLHNPNDKIVQTALGIAPKVYNVVTGVLAMDSLKYQE